jgi:uncharacterized zinc-type alcohol dehydrogenase-like protein
LPDGEGGTDHRAVPMSQINEAMQHVRDGKARYRVVLKADF